MLFLYKCVRFLYTHKKLISVIDYLELGMESEWRGDRSGWKNWYWDWRDNLVDSRTRVLLDYTKP